MKFSDYVNEANKLTQAYDAVMAVIKKNDKKFNDELSKFIKKELSFRGTDFSKWQVDDLFKDLNPQQTLNVYKIFSKKYKELFGAGVNESDTLSDIEKIAKKSFGTYLKSVNPDSEKSFVILTNSDSIPFSKIKSFETNLKDYSIAYINVEKGNIEILLSK